MPGMIKNAGNVMRLKKHEHAQDPEDDVRGNLAVAAVADPQPAQQEHGQAVDGPQREDAADGVVAGEFPCVADGVAKDFACYNFWSLKVLVGVQVAWRHGEP